MSKRSKLIRKKAIKIMKEELARREQEREIDFDVERKKPRPGKPKPPKPEYPREPKYPLKRPKYPRKPAALDGVTKIKGEKLQRIRDQFKEAEARRRERRGSAEAKAADAFRQYLSGFVTDVFDSGEIHGETPAWTVGIYGDNDPRKEDVLIEIEFSQDRIVTVSSPHGKTDNIKFKGEWEKADGALAERISIWIDEHFSDSLYEHARFCRYVNRHTNWFGEVFDNEEIGEPGHMVQMYLTAHAAVEGEPVLSVQFVNGDVEILWAGYNTGRPSPRFDTESDFYHDLMEVVEPLMTEAFVAESEDQIRF